ncbi:AIPR family protein [Chryseobacterium sp.]|uniref:AIPR family protein n=1 Tax=Chryseobacterium sp. TaxID=1871047 RepID=UPI0033429C57
MDLPEYLNAIKNSNRDWAERIRRYNNVGSSSIDAYSYIIGGLKILHPGITYRELCRSITDADLDDQIDAIVVSNNTIYIYDFKVAIGFGENDIRLFRDSVDAHVFRGDGNLLACNNLIQRKIPEINELLLTGNYNVALRVIRGGGNSDYPQGQIALDQLQYDSIIERRLISLVDLIDIELSLNKLPIDYNLNITAAKNNPQDTNSQIIIREGTDIISLVCRIQLKELVDFYYYFDPYPEKIFQSNVRGLQNSKKVTNEIVQSLSSTQKAKQFYKLHNGIAIVCDRILSIRNGKYRLENPQIVNGCQTITTISKHFQDNRNSGALKYGTVIAKIFAADTNQVEKICFASNSQVSINPWDLRTNDKIQIIIESYLNKKEISYHRKATKITNNNSLLFTELGQVLCSTMLEKPAFAKNSRAKIFSNDLDSLYHSLFPISVNLKDIYTAVKFALFVRQKIKSATPADKKILVPANLHIIAGLYLLRNENLTNEDVYNKCIRHIKSIVREMKAQHGATLTPPIIFTKHEDAWRMLKQKLKRTYRIG